MRSNFLCLFMILIAADAQAMRWGSFFKRPTLHETCEILFPKDIINEPFPERFLRGQSPLVFAIYFRQLHSLLEVGINPEQELQAQEIMKQSHFLTQMAQSTFFRNAPVRNQLREAASKTIPLYRYLPKEAWTDETLAPWIRNVFVDLLRLSRLLPEEASPVMHLNEIYTDSLDALYEILANHMNRGDLGSKAAAGMLEALDESLPRLLLRSQGIRPRDYYIKDFLELQLASLRLWHPILKLDATATGTTAERLKEACEMLKQVAYAEVDERIRKEALAALQACSEPR